MDSRKIVVISGPSGVGKSTVVQKVLETCPLPLELSVSATTRAPRAGEIDGKDYVFLSRDEFEDRRQRGEFLECKEVFGRGDWYGTLKNRVATGLSDGKWVLLEIDVEGALSVKEQCPDVLMIFLHPGSMETLEHRLRSRKSDSEDSIRRRLEVAAGEIAKSHAYDVIIENDSVEQTAQKICQVLKDRQALISKTD